MNIPAGAFDRRVAIEQCVETQDGAGDVVKDWGPPDGWPNAGRRWARRRDAKPSEQPSGAVQQVLRQGDTVWTLRDDSYSRAIAPETFRFTYKGKVFEIVGLTETHDRGDALAFLCSSRPDHRGPRGTDDTSA